MTEYYSFSVWAADAAEVSVFVNGIPVEVFTPGQSGGGPMNYWLMNGPNDVVFEMKSLGDEAQATAGIEISGPEGSETLASFEWPGSDSPARFTLEAEGLPAWTWLKAEKVPGAEAEVKAAVQAMHAHAKAGDKAAFLRMAEGLNADMTVMAGDPQLVEENNDRMWTELRAGLQPLGDLTVTEVREGQLYRVTGEGGLGPIQAEDAEGGVLSMGHWWGKVGGSWQVVK